jgi:hypothetical protein
VPIVPNRTFSCPVCGVVCEAEFGIEQSILAFDFTIICADHGRQRVQLTAWRHSAQCEDAMVTAFPKAIRKHVRSLLPKIERAEFDATYAGTRLPALGEFERWQELAASFKPEPPRALS